MKIEKCSPQCGSVVTDIQLAKASTDQIAVLKAALFERGVLFFRNQDLSVEDHLVFARKFGDIVINKFFGEVPGYPEIAEVRK